MEGNSFRGMVTEQLRHCRAAGALQRRDPRLTLALWALGAFTVARVTSLSAMLLVGWHQGLKPGVLLTGWDGVYYRAIVVDGYVPGAGQMAFFPLYSLLVKPLVALGLGFATAGLLVVLISGGTATVLIALLVCHFGDYRTALLTAALWSAQPAAYVLSVTYSEALFTALAAGCLLALVNRRWLVAGLCAAGASATRPTGWALTLACAVAVIMALRREPRAVVAALLAPLGAVAFFGYLWRATGQTLLAWLATERRGWGVYVDGGLYNLYWSQHVFDTATIYAGLGHPWLPLVHVPVLLTLAFVGVVLLVVDRAPLPVLAYAAALVGMALVTAGAYPSLPRFLLPAFPTLIPLVRRLFPRHFAPAVAVWMVTLLIMTGLGVVEFGYLRPGDPAP